MSKVELDNLTNLQNETSVVNKINANNDKIEVAMEKTLSRDGTSPNEMNANLDMNNYRIYNLPEPVTSTEPLRKQDANEILALADEFQEAIDATQGAVDAYESIQQLYLGEKTVFPVVDNTGQPLQNGALVSMVSQPNPDDDGMYVYHNGAWGPIGVLPAAFERVETVLISSNGQTTVTIPNGYTVGSSQFFLNGIYQTQGATAGTGPTDADIVANNGTSITFPAATTLINDRVVALITTPYVAANPIAVNVTFTPGGGVSSSNVQSAITEVQGHIPAKASSAEVVTGTDDAKYTTALGVAAAIAAAGATPGMAYLSTGAVSSGTITIPLGTTYRRIKLAGRNLSPVTSGSRLLMQVSTDGGSTWISTANAYRWLGVGCETGVALSNLDSVAGDTKFNLSFDQAVAGTGTAALEVEIDNSGTSSNGSLSWRFRGHKVTSGSFASWSGDAILFGVTTRWTHVRFYMSSGNINSIATISAYGLKD